MTLDELLDRFGKPDLVKIDVEGAELLCLQAAGRLLDTARPVLLLEVGSENSAAVGELLRKAGYVLYDAAAAKEDRSAITRPTWDTLAVPSEIVSLSD